MGGFFVNLILATITLFTGIIGIIITRVVKWSWNKAKWSWFPFFWIPVLGSWPVSIWILFGGFNP